MEHNLEIGSVVSTSELETIQRHRENNQTCYWGYDQMPPDYTVDLYQAIKRACDAV